MVAQASPTTFAHSWSHAVGSRPFATFLVFEGPDGHVAEWSYATFDTQVSKVAMFLTDAGVGHGHSVHLALANSPTFVAVWLAAVRLGAWIVPSDPMGKTPELAEHIERTHPTVGFCSRDRVDVYRAAAPPDLAVVEVDEADIDFMSFGPVEFGDWPEPAPTDRAAVMFTSGTTGRPKGVEVTQANYAFAGKVMAEAAALGPDDRQLVVLPLFHANAQYYSFASAIWAGASVALMNAFSASGFLMQAARHRATCASLFAAPIRMILARTAEAGRPAPRELSLRHCWYAQNIAPDQYATITEWFGCAPRQLYGMTETLPAVLTNPEEDPRADSMGVVTPGCEVDLHDRTGRPVAAGTEGEVVVAGHRGATLFAGYLDDPDTTAASLRGHWFRTGDRARRDAAGRFYFTGRGSDVLKVAGENVSTVEVESVLSAHPGVLEAAVVGAPDPIRDEVPVAFAVPADPDAPPTVDAPMSSLVDIAFLLLIFFIVTTTILKRETDLDLKLPVPGETGPTTELPVTINVDELGSVLVGSGRHLELVEPAGTGLLNGELRKRLQFAVAGAAPDELPVMLDISDQAAQQRVIAVLDTLAGLGIRQVNLIER